MSVDEDARFADLKKMPDKPAAEILAKVKAKPIVAPDTPADASVADMLKAFDGKASFADQFQLLAHALPVREGVWWACLAAEAYFPGGPETYPEHLTAAKAWVRKPGGETRAATEKALQSADPVDDTTPCAQAALYAKGTMGTGLLDDMPTKPGFAGLFVYRMVLSAWSLAKAPEEKVATGRRLVDQALDIARGGNGRVS